MHVGPLVTHVLSMMAIHTLCIQYLHVNLGVTMCLIWAFGDPCAEHHGHTHTVYSIWMSLSALFGSSKYLIVTAGWQAEKKAKQREKEKERKKAAAEKKAKAAEGAQAAAEAEVTTAAAEAAALAARYGSVHAASIWVALHT